MPSKTRTSMQRADVTGALLLVDVITPRVRRGGKLLGPAVKAARRFALKEKARKRAFP